MKLFETNDQAVNWTNTAPTDTPQAYEWAVRKAKAAQHRHDVLFTRFAPYANHMVKSNWQGKFGSPVLQDSIAKIGYYSYGIAVGTPNADKLQDAIERIGKPAAKALKAVGKYTRMAAKLKKTYRVETFNDLKYKVDPKSIPSTEVPRRIYYEPARYFNNPYWDRDDVIKQYAGPVGHFPGLAGAEATTLVELERALKKHGIPGMTKAYGAVYKSGKREWIRFVAFGADDRLIWKRIGSNTVYIDGKKVSITDIINSSNATQSAALASLKEPKP